MVKTDMTTRVLLVLLTVATVCAGLLLVASPKAYADAGEILGTRNADGGYSGPYRMAEGDDNAVWCADFGKMEPMGDGGTQYSEPERIEGVSDEDLKVVVYALQEGQKAIEEGNDQLAGAVAAVIHSSGINQGAPFDPATMVPEESRDDFNRIISEAPDVPGETWLTARIPVDYTPGGRDGYQRVLDYDQIKTGVLEIEKLDASTGDMLEGAQFTIVDAEDNPVIEGARHTRGDRPYRVQVNEGDYRVIEGSAPDGYTLNGDQTDVDNSLEASVSAGETVTVTFANQPLTEITVRKIDGEGSILPGAKLRITGENTKVDFTSAEKPHVIRVNPGEYTVEELQAPEGYNRETESLQVKADSGDKPVVEIVNVQPEVVESTEIISDTTTPQTTEVQIDKAPEPEIGSQAHIVGGTTIREGGTIVDQVVYSGLESGKEYTLETQTHCVANGEPTGNTADTTFTPESSAGSVDVEIPVTDDDCAVQVVFQELLADGDVVAEHKDLQDEAQTVGTQPVPKKQRVVIESIPSGPTGDKEAIFIDAR